MNFCNVLSQNRSHHHPPAPKPGSLTLSMLSSAWRVASVFCFLSSGWLSVYTTGLLTLGLGMLKLFFANHKVDLIINVKVLLFYLWNGCKALVLLFAFLFSHFFDLIWFDSGLKFTLDPLLEVLSNLYPVMSLSRTWKAEFFRPDSVNKLYFLPLNHHCQYNTHTAVGINNRAAAGDDNNQLLNPFLWSLWLRLATQDTDRNVSPLAAQKGKRYVTPESGNKQPSGLPHYDNLFYCISAYVYVITTM